MNQTNFEFMLSRHESDELVALAGDWHGNTVWASSRIELLKSRGVSLIFHLGDFGVWPGRNGKRYLMKVSESLEEANTDLVVTLGNHEDWSRIEILWKNSKRQSENGDPIPFEIAPRIWLLPRPYNFQFQGKSFLSLGGAASVDFEDRVPQVNWWPEEMITHEMVSKAQALGSVDVMLTHETPDTPHAVPSVTHILSTNPIGFSQMGLTYSAASRRKLDNVFAALRPRLLAHGHMHTFGRQTTEWEDGERSTVVSLNCDNKSGNLALIDFRNIEESLARL